MDTVNHVCRVAVDSMQVVCISDTHLQHKGWEVPDGDILIHAGDATWTGTPDEINQFAQWFRALPHRHKIFVPGNHDWLFERDPERARALMMGEHVSVLIDEGIEIETAGQGIRIYGSPWQPWFHAWAFNLHRHSETLREKWDKIPLGLDILVTHGPPWGRCDETVDGYLVGCEWLRIAVDKKKPKYHIFGHIHNGYGRSEDPDTKFINASICNEHYKPVNAPIVFEI